jgi:hypothetical protein
MEVNVKDILMLVQRDQFWSNSLDNTGQAFTNRHCLIAYVITNQALSAVKSKIPSEGEIHHCWAELDSHVDRCEENYAAKIFENHDQVAEVNGFGNTMEPLQEVLIVKAALAYDFPDMGETLILMIN